MTESPDDILRFRHRPKLEGATMVLAFSGWMDGGAVSPGTVERLMDLLDAKPIAEIDSEPFYIYNFPGSMEMTALFRPHIEIKDGLITTVDMPGNVFYCHEPANLVFFIGKEPNLRWRQFGECIFYLAHEVGVSRILFVGSFGGAVPHTRQPQLQLQCHRATFGVACDWLADGLFQRLRFSRSQNDCRSCQECPLTHQRARSCR